MEKIFTLFLLACATCAQAQVVSNVRAALQDTTIVIVYDLQSDATTNLEVSFDGGTTFIPATSVVGDIGKTTIGDNKIAYWNAVKDAGYFDCDKMVFKVIASDILLNIPRELSYEHFHVYQDGQDITKHYVAFLAQNCREAYRTYMITFVGMIIGGAWAALLTIPIGIDASYKSSIFGKVYGAINATAYAATGISLMCCSAFAARRYSVKEYNKINGFLDNTALNKKTANSHPMQLSLGQTSEGIGLALHF